MNMDRNKLESLLIDYIDGRLNTVDKQRVEQELVRDQEAYKFYEQLREVMLAMDKTEPLNPSDNLKRNFDHLLGVELDKEKKSKTIFFTPFFYRVAAGIALLVIGGGIGYWISQKNSQSEEIVALQKEMALTRKLVLNQLNDDQSASQRILGVQAAYESVKANKPDDEIVNALVITMNQDENSNVRLAAIDALSRFTDEAKVRTALIRSLASQADPVVQIALIQLLVKMKEKEAVKSLQKIIDDDTTLPAVKDEAYVGIFKLS
jgi:HEAT repeat protein